MAIHNSRIVKMECESSCGVYFHPTIECPLMLHWHHFSWGTFQTNIYLFSNTGSAALQSKKIFDLVSREANLQDRQDGQDTVKLSVCARNIHTRYKTQPTIDCISHVIVIIFLPKMFPESCIPACGHCLVWCVETGDRRGMLECCLGPAPHRLRHIDKNDLWCVLSLSCPGPAWPTPVNGAVSDLTWRGSPLARCTPCTPPWPDTGPR